MANALKVVNEVFLRQFQTRGKILGSIFHIVIFSLLDLLLSLQYVKKQGTSFVEEF